MKKLFFYIMIGIIVVLFAGCQKKEKTLTICVDFNYVEQVDDLIKAWHHFNNNETEVKLIVIPRKQDEAEIKLTEIRTEIMSGGGPDIFILDTLDPNWAEERAVLFDNVEKTMHSEIFLPLDEYLDDAQYMHTDAYNPVIFNSGKTDEGQLVLPIYYNYYLSAVDQIGDEDSIAMPSSWDEVVNNRDMYTQNISAFFMCRFFDVFGKYVDYDSLKLKFTEDDMLARVQEAITYEKAHWELGDNKTLMAGMSDSVLNYAVANKDLKRNFYVIPSVSGGITAYVTRYAAINRNTKYPEEAFSILDILFSDQVMCDEGFVDDGKYYANQLVLSCAVFSPVHEGAFHMEYPLSSEDARALEELNSQITAVNYYSDLDKDLLDMYNQCLHVSDEADQREIVNRIYAKMQMKLSE